MRWTDKKFWKIHIFVASTFWHVMLNILNYLLILIIHYIDNYLLRASKLPLRFSVAKPARLREILSALWSHSRYLHSFRVHC